MTQNVFNWFGQPEQPAIPSLLSARAVGRRTVELVFDGPVLVRPTAVIPKAPADRYTAVDWVAAGGSSYDAANPANYVLSRPAGGVNSGAGESPDPIATWAVEAEGYWTEADADRVPYRYATRVWVFVDYQWRPLTDHRIILSNIRAAPTNPGIESNAPTGDRADFAGYVVSQVDRGSLRIDDIIGQEPFREDYTGELTAFLGPLQESFDRIVEDVDAFFGELATIERIRSEFIDGLLFDLGDPLGCLFPLTTLEKRKLARSLVRLYKEKGTCVGLINAVQLFLGVTLLGCSNAWDDVWQLGGGSYPAPIGDDLLGDSTILGPGTLYDVLGFWVYHATPGSLTADEVAKIAAIAEYMKPAHTHYLGITAP
jgi:phage tail-like protein